MTIQKTRRFVFRLRFFHNLLKKSFQARKLKNLAAWKCAWPWQIDTSTNRGLKNVKIEKFWTLLIHFSQAFWHSAARIWKSFNKTVNVFKMYKGLRKEQQQKVKIVSIKNPCKLSIQFWTSHFIKKNRIILLLWY